MLKFVIENRIIILSRNRRFTIQKFYGTTRKKFSSKKTVNETKQLVFSKNEPSNWFVFLICLYIYIYGLKNISNK
jgi:hypothetical protein